MATLLIVDDHPANLSMLVDAAAAAGHRVRLAESGERALDVVTRSAPDLILLDVKMPGLDGFEVCRRLKRMPAAREVPVIFVTALGEVIDKVAGLEAGAVDYVTKPLEPLEVLARVKVHLELRALRTELAARNAELESAVRRRDEAERALRRSLDRAIVVATLDGEILFATHRATGLLADHFQSGDQVLPAELLASAQPGTALEPELTTRRGRLRVRRFAETGAAECVTLLFEERSAPDSGQLVALGLTEREAEVLFWIAEGKSNADIALILANTAGTVKKQVQSVLDKLNVENRTTAARIALETLGRSSG